jgi:Heterokaryon incompatibility protein (HET)
MSLVKPFTQSTYPHLLFWSLNCFLQRWLADHGDPFRVLTSNVLNLSYENKEALLRTAREKHKKGVPSAEEMIKRIAELDPQIGKAFKTKSLVIESMPVRMVRLQNSGKSVKMETTWIDSFIALSYCWHSPEWKLTKCLRKDPSLNVQNELPISQKMWTALSILRNSDDEAIWVDQLCISQDNPIEKYSAITGMDVIYDRARLVVVALEDIELSRHEISVWDLSKRRYRATSDNAYAPTEEELQTVNGALNKLFSARWFSRAWCFQEYLVGRDCVFLVVCEGDVVQIPSWSVMATIKVRYAIGALPPKVFAIMHGFTCKFMTEPNHSIMVLFTHISMRK